MRQIPENSELCDRMQPIVRENVAGVIWITLLIGAGCLVMNGLAENARRNECLMRGATLCSNALPIETDGSPRQTRATEEQNAMAAYLKGSRGW